MTVTVAPHNREGSPHCGRHAGFSVALIVAVPGCSARNSAVAPAAVCPEASVRSTD